MAPPRIGPGRVLLDIVEQHAEEAAFLWLLRDKAVDAPHYAPRHLARLEERVEAHLDGLRVAGEVGFEIATAELDRHREMGELFAVSVLALEVGRPGPAGTAARGGAGGAGSPARPVRRDRLGRPHRPKPWARAWLEAADPLERLLGVVACSLHRVDLGSRLAGFLADPDPAVRARAYRLVGELGRADLRDAVADAMAREEGVARDWAAGRRACSATRWRCGSWRRWPRATVRSPGRRWRSWRGRSAPERVMAWVRALNGERGKHRLAAPGVREVDGHGAADRGGPESAMPARLAGGSFALITGVTWLTTTWMAIRQRVPPHRLRTS